MFIHTLKYTSSPPNLDLYNELFGNPDHKRERQKCHTKREMPKIYIKLWPFKRFFTIHGYNFKRFFKTPYLWTHNLCVSLLWDPVLIDMILFFRRPQRHFWCRRLTGRGGQRPRRFCWRPAPLLLAGQLSAAPDQYCLAVQPALRTQQWEGKHGMYKTCIMLKSDSRRKIGRWPKLTLMFLPPSKTEFICSKDNCAASGISYSTNAKPCVIETASQKVIFRGAFFAFIE